MRAVRVWCSRDFKGRVSLPVSGFLRVSRDIGESNVEATGTCDGDWGCIVF